MLYLFISTENESNCIQLLQTLADPEGEICRYFYTVSGPSKLLSRHASALNTIAGGNHEPCLLMLFDRTCGTIFPLRTGSLVGIHGHKNGQDLPMRQMTAQIKKGKLDLVVKVKLGHHVCTPNPLIFRAGLKSTLNAALPDEVGGSFLIRHHADLTPSLLTGNVWAKLAHDIHSLTAFQSSTHQVLIHSEIVTIPAAGKRLLQVQGHNYDTQLRTIAAVTGQVITHIQSISPDSDFSFFVPLPPLPNGQSTAIIEMDSRLPLCQSQ